LGTMEKGFELRPLHAVKRSRVNPLTETKLETFGNKARTSGLGCGVQASMPCKLSTSGAPARMAADQARGRRLMWAHQTASYRLVRCCSFEGNEPGGRGAHRAADSTARV